MPRCFCLTLALLLSLSQLASAQEQVVNRVVAVVGNEVITAQDLNRILSKASAQLSPSMSAEEHSRRMEAVRRLALERLIEDKIILQEVKRLKLTVSRGAVDRYLEQLKKRNKLTEEQFVARLSRAGITPEEYRAQLKRDILKQRLISREVREQVVISDEQVMKYYQENRDEFTNPGKVTMQAIFFRASPSASRAELATLRRQALKVHEKIVKGADFSQMVRQHSQGPGAAKGGRIGPLKGSDLLFPMRQALSKLKPGQVSNVVAVPGGFVIMKLLARSGAQDPANLASVKETIRQKLYRQAVEKRFRNWLKDLRSKVYVRVIQ